MMAGQQNERSRTAAQAGSTRDESLRRRRFWRGLVAAAAICLAIAGAMVARHYRQVDAGSKRQGHAGQTEPPITEAWAKSFSEPAFSQQATIHDMEQETMRVIGALIADCPNTPASFNQRARLHYSLGNIDEAKESWRQCLKLDPGSADAHYGLGYLAWEQSDYEAAADCFVRVLARSPEDLRIPYLLGDSLMKQGKIKEAVAVLERNVRAQKASVAVLVCLGQAYLQLKEYDRAKQVFEVAIGADPSQKQAYYGLATAHSRLGETEEYEHCMEKFKTLATNVLRDHGQRIRAFDDLVEARKMLTSVYTASGIVYAEQTLPDKAEEMWRRAAVLDPQGVECREKLLQLYDGSKRTEEAVRVCEELCRIEPENADHWLDLALLNSQLARWDAAIEAIEKAIELAPENTNYRKTYDLIQKAR